MANSKAYFAFRIEGMTCDGCARHVTKALEAVPGVEQAEVGSWKSGRAVVISSPDVSSETLIKAVRKAGYAAVLLERRSLEAEKQIPSTGAGFDLMIIGGGSAAFAAAIKAAELGARIAIIEKGVIGGTCVNIGCVPSKTLIKAAELCYHSAYPNFEGLTACAPPSDWQRVVAQKDELVAALRQEKYVHVAGQYPNITIFKGEAKFAGRRQVILNGETYSPGKIVIATGSLPLAPPIPGLQEAGYIDSTEALSLSELPDSLIIIGAGSIGLEFAQLFARFGVRVMVLEGQAHLAAAQEPEIGEAITRYFEEEKIGVCLNARIEGEARQRGRYVVSAHIDGKVQECEAARVMIATG